MGLSGGIVQRVLRAPLLLALGCHAPSAPDWTGHLVFDDRTLGRATHTKTAEGDHTWTFSTHYRIDGQVVSRVRTEVGHLDPTGRLESWQGRDGDRITSILFGPDGNTSWRHERGGTTREGVWMLPARPFWTLNPPCQAEVGATAPPSLFWDGHQAATTSATCTSSAPAEVVHIGSPFHLTLRRTPEGALADIRWDDGGALLRGASATAPVDPVALTQIDADPLTSPRSSRELIARWSSAAVPFTRSRPLRQEIPRHPSPQHIPTSPTTWTLPPLPPLGGPPPASADRVATVDALLQRAIAAIRPGATLGPADPRRVDRRDLADCNDLSAWLVRELRVRGIHAEPVQGWLHTGTELVRHTWVRVAFDERLPWLEVDPALGQLIADAAHIPRHLVPPIPPSQLRLHIESHTP